MQYLSGCLSTKNRHEKPLFDLVTPTGLATLFEKVARGQIAQSIRHLGGHQFLFSILLLAEMAKPVFPKVRKQKRARISEVTEA